MTNDAVSGTYVVIPEGVRPPAMTPEFQRLAQYNAERHRGIAHTPEYDDEMRQLQAKWDEWWKPYVR